MASVYGEVKEIGPLPGTIIFIAVIVLITVLEYLFDCLDEIAKRKDCVEILIKLKFELMILGMISFTVFIFESSAGEELTSSEWFEAFDLAHILILFIAIAFIVQALFLFQYATNAGKHYLLHLRAATVDCLDRLTHFEEMKVSVTAPDYVDLVNTIEFKILEKLFFETYKQKGIATTFDVAKYVGYLFHTYIAEIGEVSKLSWLMLAVLVALNLIRVYAIDPIAVAATCGEPEEEGEICAEYYIQYGIVLGVMVNIFVVCVYWASRKYSFALIDEGLKTRSVVIKECKTVSGKENATTDKLFAYKQFLLKVKCEEEELEAAERMGLGKSSSSESDIAEKTAALKAKGRASWKVLQNSVRAVNELGKTASKDETSTSEAPLVEKPKRRPMVSRKESMAKLKEAREVEENKHFHNEALESSKPMYERLCAYLNSKEWLEKMFKREKNPDIDKIFWLGDPRLFFKAIEFAFLLQCFYISMYLTQLLPLATDTKLFVLWLFLLTVPIVVGFVTFRQILTNAVLLYTMSSLHSEVVDKVCTVVILEETICDEVREKIIVGMSDVSEEGKVNYIRGKFREYDVDDSKSISHDEFRLLLGNSLKVYLTLERFDILWKVIDFDLSGEVTWDEVFVFVFPHLKKAMKEELKTVTLLRNKFQQYCQNRDIPESEWMNTLRQQFHEFDTDHSDSIEKLEFKLILDYFDISMTEKAFSLLFAAIDEDAGGGIGWDEFVSLILPDYRPSIAFGSSQHGAPRNTITSRPVSWAVPAHRPPLPQTQAGGSVRPGENTAVHVTKVQINEIVVLNVNTAAEDDGITVSEEAKFGLEIESVVENSKAETANPMLE
jgi:Ca2+-binding EF-hand superfamily protein